MRFFDFDTLDNAKFWSVCDKAKPRTENETYCTLQAQPSPGRHQRQAEAAFGARIERLNQDLASKTRTIQELSRTVERLQKERRNMLSVPSPRPDTRSTETKRQPGPAKTLCSATAGETNGEEETFPAAQYEKTYQPTVFTGMDLLFWLTFLCTPR